MYIQENNQLQLNSLQTQGHNSLNNPQFNQWFSNSPQAVAKPTWISVTPQYFDSGKNSGQLLTNSIYSKPATSGFGEVISDRFADVGNWWNQARPQSQNSTNQQIGFIGDTAKLTDDIRQKTFSANPGVVTKIAGRLSSGLNALSSVFDVAGTFANERAAGNNSYEATMWEITKATGKTALTGFGGTTVGTIAAGAVAAGIGVGVTPIVVGVGAGLTAGYLLGQGFDYATSKLDNPFAGYRNWLNS